MVTKRSWVKVIIPPALARIPIAQEAARHLARECGFPASRISFIELAIEETVGTILRYITEDDDLEDAQLHIQIEVEAPLFRVCIVNKGLPFELTDVPEYDAAQLKAMISAEEKNTHPINGKNDNFNKELALFLLKKSVDRYHIHNAGKDGVFFQLEWFLPDKHISEQPEQKETKPDTAIPAPQPAVDSSAIKPEAASMPQEAANRICALTATDAMGISRLIYRSYGTTYPNEDFYFPARLRAHQKSGRIKSWGAITPSGKIVGHLALTKSHPTALAVEWGTVVVDPLWRGAGLMKKMLTAAIKEMEQRAETVFYAHAVTTHPFTQKTCNRFGFVPTALLLGFASDNLRFRGIQEQVTHRENMFLSARLLRPLPPQRLFPPIRHRKTLARLFAGLGLSLDELTALPAASPRHEKSGKPDALQQESKSVTSTTSISSINIATIDVIKIGADFSTLLARGLRRLCRERMDMIYLNIDLSDPAAETGVYEAEKLGFFLAGWLPLQPFPYGIALQYANTVKIDFHGVIAEGEQAVWLKQVIAQERERVEDA